MSFAPVYSENSRALILGTWPSPKSREMAFYYGHPQNRFWPMMAALTGEPVPAREDIEAKKGIILRHGLALWDTLESCTITSAFEHHAIMHSMAALERLGFEVTYIKPTTEGYIRPEDVEAAIRPDTALISIMMANNEIGTIQPIKEIAEIAHKHGVWMHTDAVQAVGSIPVDVKELGVDMLSMSAHKFNGPKGMGALYCRKGIWPQNLIDGGSQEARHRAGTENVAGIAGMGKALEMATEHLEERMAHEKELRDYVIDRILKSIPEARLNGGLEHRLPGNVNISFPGLEGETILLDLDMHGICASTGSACNSDSLDPSHVLLSIGVPEEIGHGSMRFTFGPQNTMEEAKYLCDVLEEVIPRRRAMSCMWLQGQNTARHFSLKGEN